MKRLKAHRITGLNLATVFLAWESGNKPRRAKVLVMPEVFGVSLMVVRSGHRPKRSDEIHERTMKVATELHRLNRAINTHDLEAGDDRMSRASHKGC